MLGKQTRRVIGGGLVVLGCMAIGFGALLPLAARGLGAVYPNESMQAGQGDFRLAAIMGLTAIIIGILLVITSGSDG